MPEALYPAEETAQDVSFELDAFALIGADRLELTGRWFGVRGRRFVRPMLTLSIGDESQRSLADLEHKPWAAEDGQPWTAAFPLEADAAEEFLGGEIKPHQVGLDVGRQLMNAIVESRNGDATLLVM